MVFATRRPVHKMPKKKTFYTKLCSVELQIRQRKEKFGNPQTYGFRMIVERIQSSFSLSDMPMQLNEASEGS